jgi:hypothetical protein
MERMSHIDEVVEPALAAVCRRADVEWVMV